MKIHIYICVFALLITAVISLSQGVTLGTLTLRLIVTACLFYAIGLAARHYIMKILPAEKDDDE
ncbi:MAG: hypothetical protein LBL35_04910 [Clostridiales bacterium]|jgi:hypothetical protein|nr:hypothetical protein [Clostridiales bacterium]